MNRARVPLVDLEVQHREVADDIQRGWDAVLRRSAFVLGDEVEAFEDAYASFIGVRHCVGVASGTDALELALRAMRIGPGDEVLVPANTFVASVAAVLRSGAVPVLVDVDPVTGLLDPTALEPALTPRTRAVLPVHLYGQVAPMAAVAAVAAEHGLLVVEDAAQAHGARQAGRPVGGLGHAAATSFYPSKNLGAYGDGGAVLTDDDDVARRVRRLRNYGGEAKNRHTTIGFNSRLDTLQAVVLDAKLRRLSAWNEARRAAADTYGRLLAAAFGVTPPVTAPGNLHAWHLYVVRVPDRDRVAAALDAAGVDTGVHYPVPVHLLPAFAFLGRGPGSFPVAEQAAGEILSLPLFPGISAAQQERVVGALVEATAGARAVAGAVV